MARSWVRSAVVLGLLQCALAWGQETAPTPAAPPQPGQEQQAPRPPLQPPVTTIQAHARAVVLDVVVTDKNGHPVHGLKAQDFQVMEDGAPQRVASFEEIQPPSAEERARLAGAKLPPNTFSNANKVLAANGTTGAYTVLLLDALDTAPEWQSYAHDQLVKFVNTGTITGPVAIFALDTQLHLIQGFTTDIDVLRQAVKERAQVMLTPIPRTPGYVTTQLRFDGLTGAMRDLGQYLGRFPGRKNLIWFTGSVPVYAYNDGTPVGGALRDPETFSFDFSSTTDVLTLGRVSVYPIDAEGLRTDPAFSAASSRIPTARSISNFGLRQGTRHEDLDDVARATGGKAFYNTNDLKAAIAEVVDTGANYYTLTYYPSNKDWDGKFRKLKLDLDVQGDDLQYRRGYYALAETNSPDSRSTAGTSARRQITNHPPDGFWQTMHLGAIDPGTIVFQTHVTPQAGEQKLAKGAPMPTDNYLEEKYRDKPYREFEVDYKVPGKQFQLTPTAAGTVTGKVEFALVVVDDKGALVNSFNATIDMNLKPATYAYLLKNGVEFPAKIAVPVKGNYFIRAGVHDFPSGKAGAVEVNMGEITMDGVKP